MRILVTGSAGMLGSALIPALLAVGHSVTTTDIDLSRPYPWGEEGPRMELLDVRDRRMVENSVKSLQPDAVLHLAAETSLEVCDAEQDHAFLTNTIGTKYVAQATRRHGAQMVYISTAGVFDGEKDDAYVEFDRPNPLNAYGASKLEGEYVVERFVDRHFIVRAGWMVGGGAGKDHKFVARIVNQIAGGAKTVYAVTDKLGTPTYAPDFSACLINLLTSELYGRYHMACEGRGTRYDVAAHILRVLDRPDIELVEVGSDFFAEEFPSVRPRSEIMRNMVLDLQGMNSMRPWQVALEEYLTTEFAHLCASAPQMATA